MVIEVGGCSFVNDTNIRSVEHDAAMEPQDRSIEGATQRVDDDDDGIDEVWSRFVGDAGEASRRAACEVDLGRLSSSKHHASRRRVARATTSESESLTDGSEMKSTSPAKQVGSPASWWRPRETARSSSHPNTVAMPRTRTQRRPHGEAG